MEYESLSLRMQRGVSLTSLVVARAGGRTLDAETDVETWRCDRHEPRRMRRTINRDKRFDDRQSWKAWRCCVRREGRRKRACLIGMSTNRGRMTGRSSIRNRYGTYSIPISLPGHPAVFMGHVLWMLYAAGAVNLAGCLQAGRECRRGRKREGDDQSQQRSGASQHNSILAGLAIQVASCCRQSA